MRDLSCQRDGLTWRATSTQYRWRPSPVDQVSRLINRVILCVYNKLVNLRARDPRVDAAGLAGSSKIDEQVWAEFFDAGAQSIRMGPRKSGTFQLHQIDVDPYKNGSIHFVIGFMSA